MSDRPTTTITIRLTQEMRDRIRTQATAEERSESGYIRYHIGQALRMDADEAEVDEFMDEEEETP